MADFNQLTERLLAFAKDAIAKDGFLVPIAAGFTREGDYTPFIGIEQPSPAAPDVQEMVRVLSNALGQAVREQGYRSVAWCLDTRTIPPGSTKKVDALAVYRESIEAADLFILPYRRTFWRRLRVGTPWTVARDATFFTRG